MRLEGARNAIRSNRPSVLEWGGICPFCFSPCLLAKELEERTQIFIRTRGPAAPVRLRILNVIL